MRLYNLFPRLAGRFNEWTPHLDRAAQMGFDWIFVNPVQQTGRSGSLYSISDYFSLNRDFCDPDSKKSPDDQLKAVTAHARGLGLRMMVDLVINHCAEDAALVHEHANWFQHEHDGSVAHPFCMEDGNKVVWYDLARFDHRGTNDREGLHNYFVKIIEYLIGLGFDGFRCDAAYQLPRDMWQRLIHDIKLRHPDTVFTAETLGCTGDQTRQTAQAGFDFVFNSSKWWDFGSPWLLEQYQLVRESAPSISFPESHDTARLCEEMHGNVEALKQRYLFAATFSAGVMIPIGYEFGFRKQMNVVSTTPGDWEQTDIDLCDYISKINAVKAKYKVFQEDCPTTIIGYDNPGIMLMWKASTKSSDEALIVLNKDPWNRQHFYVDNLRQYVQAGAPLIDVSPDNPLEYLPVPFSYELRPGEGLIMVTERDPESDNNG